MKNRKRILACLLIVAFLMPMLKVDMVRAEETDAYKKTVLDNYDEYIQTSQESFWLTYDERYHYELLADHIKQANFSWKLDMETAYTVLGEKLTVDDAIAYLSTILYLVDSGMNDNIQAQIKHNRVKDWKDYLKEGMSIAADACGLQEVTDAAKEVQDLIGIHGEAFNTLMSYEESGWDMVAAMQTYIQHTELLTVIGEKTTYPEVKEAANLLMGVEICQTGYLIETASKTLNTTGKYMLKTNEGLIMEGLEKWIGDNEGRLSKISGLTKYGSVSEMWACTKMVKKILKPLIAGMKLGIWIGDLAVGNSYRYLKEVMALDDISAALQEAIRESDPMKEKRDEERYWLVKKQVPLLEALCAVRARGEYCANSVAMAKDTPFNWIYFYEQEQEERLERDIELINQEYQMLSEIFIVDDFVVSILWHNVEEVTEMKNGDPFCIADITYPEVLYSSAIGADQTITDYLRNEAEEIRGSYLETHFNWKGSDGRYDVEEGNPHYFTLSYGDIARMDEQVISLAGSMSTYYSGAAHGATVSTRYNFDTQTGTPLTLGNIVEDENAYKLLCDLASLYVDPEKADKENIKDTVKQQLLKHGIVDCYEDWFFTTEGLHITFPPYSIASGYLGSIDIDIPYTELMGVVKEDYLSLKPRSEKGTDICGEVTEGVDISGTSNIYFCDGPGDGKYTLALTSEGIVYDVTVHETKSVSWDYQYVYAKWPLISLSTMSASSKIIVDCGVSQDEAIPNLMITWTDGLGQKRTSLMGVDSSGELLEIMIK